MTHIPTPIPQVTVASAQAFETIERKARIEEKLAHLQESNRLAIHMAEDHKRFTFPAVAQAEFAGNVKTGVDKGIAEHDPYLMSMSLLPNRASGIAIEPFGLNSQGRGHLGYLVNVDQNRKDPARIVFACHKNIGSGEDGRAKVFWERLTDGSIRFPPALAKVYEGCHDELAWFKALAKDPAGLSDQQLDAMGTYFDGLGKLTSDDDRVKKHNEILVAAAPEHVEAISVVMTAETKLPPFHKEFIQLTAALAGIQHADHGIDLPVVCYHQDYVNHRDTHAPICEYWAQGKAECVELALAAIEKLQSNKNFMHASRGEMETREWLNSVDFMSFKKEVEAALHIKLGVPLEQQAIAVAQLRAEVAKEHAEARLA